MTGIWGSLLRESALHGLDVMRVALANYGPDVTMWTEGVVGLVLGLEGGTPNQDELRP